ncbi:hypothetical protein GCM10011350_26800 [Marinomonas arctica]|nr:hypothetical protein GCM10011350_26800 [Marinomonas arctica]
MIALNKLTGIVYLIESNSNFRNKSCKARTVSTELKESDSFSNDSNKVKASLGQNKHINHYQYSAEQTVVWHC